MPRAKKWREGAAFMNTDKNTRRFCYTCHTNLQYVVEQVLLTPGFASIHTRWVLTHGKSLSLNPRVGQCFLWCVCMNNRPACIASVVSQLVTVRAYLSWYRHGDFWDLDDEHRYYYDFFSSTYDRQRSSSLSVIQTVTWYWVGFVFHRASALNKKVGP